MEAAKYLVIMPCCYHKMALNDGKFKNFPLSRCLKTVFDELSGAKFLKVPFLRLGAQPPEVADNLENSVFNLMARAVLQLYAHKRKYIYEELSTSFPFGRVCNHLLLPVTKEDNLLFSLPATSSA